MYYVIADDTGHEKELCHNVRNLADLKDVENSLLLCKPASILYAGDNLLSVADYNTILNGIWAGAPCGTSVTH